MNSSKRTSQENCSYTLIKSLLDNNEISGKEIDVISKIDYPLFSFRYLKEVSYTESKDCKFLSGVITRLHKFSEIGWKQMRLSSRHGFGLELLPKEVITCSLPPIVTPEVKKVHLLRDSGDNRVMIGLRENRIFHIFFICENFMDFYTHGNKK